MRRTKMIIPMITWMIILMITLPVLALLSGVALFHPAPQPCGGAPAGEPVSNVITLITLPARAASSPAFQTLRVSRAARDVCSAASPRPTRMQTTISIVYR